MTRMLTSPMPPGDMRWKHVGGALTRMTICIVAVAAITAVLHAVPLHDRPLSASLTFLLGVLIVSAAWGFRYAIFLSLLTALGFSWLLPPVGVFWIDDPREVVRLVAFLFIGILASGLLDRARKEARKVKQREEDLRRSEAYLVEGQKLTHTGSWAWNPVVDEVLYWSEEMFLIFGLDPRNGIPTRETFRQRVHPEDRDKVYELIQTSVRQKIDYLVEHRIRLPDGNVRYLETIGHPVLNAAGEVVEYIGTAIDVTERMRAQDALRQSEQRLRDVIDAIPAMVWSTLPDGTNDFANQSWLEYTGISAKDVSGAGWRVSFHPDDIATHLEKWGASLATGKPFENEARIQRAGDGEYRWFLHHSVPLRDENGDIRKWYGISTDIGERKRVERELREAETRFRTYVDHATDAFYVIARGEKAQIIDVNRQACDSLGYTRRELIGMTPLDFDPNADKAFLQRLGTQIDAGETVTFETSLQRKDGTVFPVEVRLRPFYYEGRPLGLALARDITERKRAETEARESERRFRELHAELAHASRLATMGQLAASITHEVKQPVGATLTNAQAALRFLDREPVDLDEIRRTFGDIVKDSLRASDIFDRIRDLAKKAPPRRERFEINEAIREVIELTHGEIVKHGVSVVALLADGLPPIEGDRVQLQQVILNLIMNAIQAMAGVAVDGRELRINSESKEPDGIRISVRDSGPGLSPDSVESLFEPFYTTKSEGMGMGLSICRSIIEAHGGQLIATTNVPKGALFQFTIPVHPAES
jgi:PAS domain S-box-containing protein